MIPIDKLNAHPDNPRRHVGDVTELAESIRANGVLQNLTVVPYERDGASVPGQYTVIIGHRRMAAARLAGLEVVPCVIADMSYKEQISTMLTENMQRSDLTVYEQAQGFQMMLDMGDTVDEIADKSGFSASTIRRRVKLLELDHGKFEKAEKRGGTLNDYIALDTIKSIERKNSVLDAIGTPDFKNRLKAAQNEEKFEKRLAERVAVIRTFATEKQDINYSEYKYIRNYGYNLSAQVEIPEDDNRYYYKVTKYGVEIYTDKAAVTASERAAAKEREELEARQEPIKRRNEKIAEISRRHYELRIEFAQELTIKPEYIPELMRFAAEAIWRDGELSEGIIADLCDMDVDESTDDELFEVVTAEKPEKQLLYMLIAALDNDDGGYWRNCWNSEARTFEYEYNPVKRLNILYELLCALGYEMSGEEREMQRGTHKVFKTGGDE